MKRVVLAMLCILSLFGVRCSDDDQVYNEIPSEIMTFLNKYFPEEKVASYVHNDNTYQVVVTNGPTIVFDGSYAWKSIDGNGSTIGQMFLFDQLPPELYSYLQTVSSVNDVFAVQRTPYDYTVSLLNSKLTYTNSTGEISTD